MVREKGVTSSLFLYLRCVNVGLQLRIRFEFGRCLLLQGKTGRNFHLMGRIIDDGAVRGLRGGRAGKLVGKGMVRLRKRTVSWLPSAVASLHVVFRLEPLGLN